MGVGTGQRGVSHRGEWRVDGGGVEGFGKGAWEGVDVVSSSAVHQGVGHVDFSLKVVRQTVE